MGRLTTDNPKTKVERILNFAYVENRRVKLRYPNGSEDIDLCEYIERQRGELGFSCGVTSTDVMEGACNECDCVLAILNIVSVQAAELRERLKRYEEEEIFSWNNRQAEPVVHGNWSLRCETHADTHTGEVDEEFYLECSECKRKVWGIDQDAVISGNWRKLTADYPYCHCGAKMYGGRMSNQKMKGITCCGECGNYSWKKHRCMRGATDETNAANPFYDDCPLPDVSVAAYKWIPCSERMPEICGMPCLLTAVNGFEQIRVIKGFTNYMEGGKFRFLSNEIDYGTDRWKVIAWMPLPEPYKGGDRNE